MKRRSVALAAGVATLLTAGAAAAQQVVVVERPVPYRAHRPYRPYARRACFRHWAEGPCSYPRLSLALDLGVSSFNESGPFGFDNGVGRVTEAGPGWGGRLGVELARWFAIDAHYIGMYNAAKDAQHDGNVGLLTSAFAGEVRLTAPFRYVHPYLFVGAGVYDTTLEGTQAPRFLEPLHGSSEFGMPLGLGVGFPVNRMTTVGAELTYHRLFGESFGRTDDYGGDLFTANAVLRFRI
ncbi:MAG TPA: outer membrane beta-barrel protein [Byssovorax sp.]|jgi:opacity protein-like surface antigen